jgi:hypothetical protein
MQLPRSFFLIVPFLVTSSAFAQLPRIAFSGGFGGTRDGGFQGNATFDFPGRPIESMANAPYSGEPKDETVRTLADGTHITNFMPGRGEKVWRDSQGRVRIEESMGGGMDNKFPTIVQIEDPVAGYIYVMDDINKVAHRVKAPAAPARSMEPRPMRAAPAEGGGGGGGVGWGIGGGITGLPPAAAAASARPRPRTAGTEDLGTQMIDGVSVHGTRTTTVIPTGTVGNDGPITTTRDVWFSPELNLVIRTVTTDPRSGTQTSGIGNLSRDEPDPTLFTVPADYIIVDETGDFTIKRGEK